MACGSTYEGFFKDGKLQGAGKYTTLSGIILKGNFINFMLQGQGVRIKPEKHTYVGEFVNSKACG